MMLESEVVEKIRHLENTDLFIVATGAGAGLQDLIWSAPGVSSVLSGSAFTYSEEETKDFLGFSPERYCSEQAAYELASEAFVRAATRGYRVGNKAEGWPYRKAIGLAITASVASEREHRGDHRVHTAVVSDRWSGHWNLVIPKGVGRAQRVHDGALADYAGLDLLYYSQFDIFPALSYDHGVRLSDVDINKNIDPVSDLFWRRPYFTPDRRRYLYCNLDEATFFPGNFNPPHVGHVSMASSARRLTRKPTVLLINADNPHKPRIEGIDLLRRLAMYRAALVDESLDCPVLFTKGEPYWTDKCAARPNSTFVIGADALALLFDPQWGRSVKETIDIFKRHSANFVVFNRLVSGSMLRVHDIVERHGIDPKDAHELFESLHDPSTWDISSSQIRGEG